MSQHLLPLAIIIPFLGILTVYFVGKRSEPLGTILTAIFCGLTFLDVLFMYFIIGQGAPLEFKFQTNFPISIYFRADQLGIILSLVTTLLWLTASFYAIEYMKHEHAKTRFNVFSLFSLFGMVGIALAGNLFILYVFFEIMAFLSYLLVIHEETPEAMRAGLKYLILGVVGGLILFVAIIITYDVAGTIDLTRGGLSGLKGSPYFIWVFWAFMIGFGIKAGMVPFHIWLPDAHPVAPAPASALLSGVMIKAGAYGIIRTIYSIYGANLANNIFMTKPLLIIAIVTMILGSGVAILQKELKRMLAYSSIAQIGYVLLGAALLTPFGLTGAVLHIFNHALMKGTLFLCAGSFIHQTGLRKIEDLKGIGRRMPLTFVAFTLAALSMIGFPPLVGFVSKWYLVLGSLQAAKSGFFSQGMGIAIVGSLLLSSLLNMVYYGPIIIRGWFGEHSRQSRQREDPSWIMLVPIFTLALGVFIFGLAASLPVNLAKSVARFYLSSGRIGTLWLR